MEVMNHKPKIIKNCNLADYSSYTNSAVSIDEPLFDVSPSVVQFTDYEPLQIKDKILRLRNKDRYARRVKIIPPDSRLFQVLPNHTVQRTDIEDENNKFGGSKVRGMDYRIFDLNRWLLEWKSVLLFVSVLRLRSIMHLI
jgi:hypothetical protein